MPGAATAVNEEGYAEKHRSILTLGRSERSFNEQLSEVCSILGIDLESLPYEAQVFVHRPKTEVRADVINGPRYEWTLRWLLNKLRGDVYPGNPCLLPQAWLLLKTLIIHNNPTKVARLLSGNKYLDTLRRTLAWLRENLTSPVAPIFENSSDSSRGERRPSKKRKRDAAEIQPMEQSRETLEDMSILVLSICETLFQIQCLVDSQSEASESLVAEQLKFAMKCTPEEAANVIGNGFYLLSHVSQMIIRTKTCSTKSDQAMAGWSGGASIKSCTEILIKFWAMQPFFAIEVDHSAFVSLRWTV